MEIMNWPKIFNCQFVLMLSHLNCFTNAEQTDLIKGPPKLLNDRKSQQKLVSQGKDIRLTCPVVGNPQPIYEWWKGNEAIPNDGWERIRAQRSFLKIKRVTPEDSGMYTCIGVNGFGSEKFNIYLNVQAALGNSLQSSTGNELKVDQVFPMSGSTVTKKTGEDVLFKCLMSGEPAPDITWFKNGRIFNPSDYPHDPSDFDDPRTERYSLHLNLLSKWDSGNYSCKVMNIHGTIIFNWTLNVVSTLTQEEVFRLQLSNQTVISGEKAVLRCKGSWDSEISPKVKWLRRISFDQLDKLPENQTFAYQGNYYQVLHPSELLVLGKGIFVTELNIKDTEMNDSGVYVCLATNQLGLSFREAWLTIVERDSNFGHLMMIVSLSAVVFLIVIVAVIVTIRKKRTKRVQLQIATMNTDQSKVQMESFGRPLLPPPLVSDRGDLHPRYMIYPPVTSHQKSNEKEILDSNSRLHPNLDQMSLPSKSNESNASQHQMMAQPIVVYQDTPRSMYISSTSSNRYHIQNFNVI